LRRLNRLYVYVDFEWFLLKQILYKLAENLSVWQPAAAFGGQKLRKAKTNRHMGSWCQSIGETSLQQNTAEFDIQCEVFNSEIFSLRDYFQQLIIDIFSRKKLMLLSSCIVVMS
jgi:hypothetical protein